MGLELTLMSASLTSSAVGSPLWMTRVTYSPQSSSDRWLTTRTPTTSVENCSASSPDASGCSSRTSCSQAVETGSDARQREAKMADGSGRPPGPSSHGEIANVLHELVRTRPLFDDQIHQFARPRSDVVVRPGLWVLAHDLSSQLESAELSQ